jgi:hypothetical protein
MSGSQRSSATRTGITALLRGPRTIAQSTGEAACAAGSSLSALSHCSLSWSREVAASQRWPAACCRRREGLGRVHVGFGWPSRVAPAYIWPVSSSGGVHRRRVPSVRLGPQPVWRCPLSDRRPSERRRVFPGIIDAVISRLVAGQVADKPTSTARANAKLVASEFRANAGMSEMCMLSRPQLGRYQNVRRERTLIKFSGVQPNSLRAG